MSQKRQSSAEALAAREALDNLPENVTPLPFSELAPDLPEPEWDENDTPAPEQPLTDEDVESFLADQDGPTPEATAENLATTEDNQPTGIQVECPCCGAHMFAEVDGPMPQSEYDALAVKYCKCSGAKVLRQESEMNDKIDKFFGAVSKERFGFAHDTEETNILKLIAAYVAKRKIKAVTITLNGSDKAVILIKKDATVVRRTRSIKEETEV